MGPYAAARHRRMFSFFVSDNGTMIISCWKTCCSGLAMRLEHATRKCSPESLCWGTAHTELCATSSGFYQAQNQLSRCLR